MVKGPEAFRTISEAADELSVPQHVLRFWETKFAFIRPMKRAGGRRFYRPADIAVLSAAVADWRVDTIAGGKIKKGPGGPPTLALIENPDKLKDILSWYRQRHPIWFRWLLL